MWRLLCVVGAATGLGASTRLAVRPLVRVELPAADVVRSEPAVTTTLPRTDSLARIAIERDAFRVTRRPAAVVYDPLRLTEQVASPTPKPTLSLVGLVSGDEPAA